MLISRREQENKGSSCQTLLLKKSDSKSLNLKTIILLQEIITGFLLAG